LTNDLFAKIRNNKGPLGKWASVAEGYFAFPKLEGEIGNRMRFQGKEVITWSVNDYLGLPIILRFVRLMQMLLLNTVLLILWAHALCRVILLSRTITR
jgi:hypothetical protein